MYLSTIAKYRIIMIVFCIPHLNVAQDLLLRLILYVIVRLKIARNNIVMA